jgi:hypothetical protein
MNMFVRQTSRLETIIPILKAVNMSGGKLLSNIYTHILQLLEKCFGNA